MPPFYFDVREGDSFFDVQEGDSFTHDTDGLEFNSLDAAEYEAARAAAEIGREDLPIGNAREVSVEVRDEHDRQVLTVAVAMIVRRMNLAHA